VHLPNRILRQGKGGSSWCEMKRSKSNMRKWLEKRQGSGENYIDYKKGGWSKANDVGWLNRDA